jgi:hypothetical protein
LIRLPYEIGIPDVLFEELVRVELAEINLIDSETNPNPKNSTTIAIAKRL